MRKYRPYVYGGVALIITAIFFVIPFVFIFFTVGENKA